MTDSDNLSKSIGKDSGSMLRETLETEPFVKIPWGPTHKMVADYLTKLESPHFALFEAFMESKQYKFPPGAPKTLSTKTNIRALQDMGSVTEA